MNDFGISAKDMTDEFAINEILNISKIIIKKEDEMHSIQNNIDKIMDCRGFIVGGYKIDGGHKDRVYVNSFGDDLKSFLTKDYYDKLHKLEDEVKELKNKLIES